MADSGDAGVFVAIVWPFQKVEVRTRPPWEITTTADETCMVVWLTFVSSSPIASERSAPASNGMPSGGTMERKDAAQYSFPGYIPRECQPGRTSSAKEPLGRARHGHAIFWVLPRIITVLYKRNNSVRV